MLIARRHDRLNARACEMKYINVNNLFNVFWDNRKFIKEMFFFMRASCFNPEAHSLISARRESDIPPKLFVFVAEKIHVETLTLSRRVSWRISGTCRAMAQPATLAG